MSASASNKSIFVFVVILGFLVFTDSIASAADVGFERIQLTNGSEPPLTGGVWYPTGGAGNEA